MFNQKIKLFCGVYLTKERSLFEQGEINSK